MAQKLASIQVIHSIRQHPNPEVNKLEVAKILEWPVVIPKGQFKENDLVIYIEIDVIVPETPYFEFMRSRKFRTWPAKFKGAASAGLVCPLSVLPEMGIVDHVIKEGDEVTEILGIKKYEKALDTQLGGDAKSNFPTNLISISDEDNLLSNKKALQELTGKKIFISQKADGSSGTFIYNQNEFKACSRRLELKENSGFPWTAANKYDIKNKLEKLGINIAIQAEIIGPKFNGNKLGLKDIEIRVFRAKNLDNCKIFSLGELKDLCYKLDLPMMKVIDEVDFDASIHTVEYFRNLADSQIYSENGGMGEGIVFAPIESFHSYELNKSWSLKVINSNYKQD